MHKWGMLFLGSLVAACGKTGGDNNNNNNNNNSGAVACNAVGDACTASQTLNPGYVCVTGVCRETCTAAAVDPCPSGSYCTGGTGSYCKPSTCTDYFTDDCPTSGQKCGPVGNGASDCFANGTVAGGGACTSHGDCGADLLCLGGGCAPIQCSTTSAAAPACGNTLSCRAWTILEPTTDLGTCVSVCTPFVDGCTATTWCMPDLGTGAGQGRCVDQGTGLEGAACTSGCAEGLICIGASAATGKCRRVCALNAPASSAGDTCLGSDTCGTVGVQGPSGPVALPYGVCNPGCDYDAPVACAEPNTTCVAGEMLQSGADTCAQNGTGTGQVNVLAEFATCTGPQGSICGGLAACFDLGPAGAPFGAGNKCYQLCRSAFGAFGTSNHPDCDRPAAVCTEMFQAPAAYGVCAP